MSDEHSPYDQTCTTGRQTSGLPTWQRCLLCRTGPPLKELVIVGTFVSPDFSTAWTENCPESFARLEVLDMDRMRLLGAHGRWYFTGSGNVSFAPWTDTDPPIHVFVLKNNSRITNGVWRPWITATNGRYPYTSPEEVMNLIKLRDPSCFRQHAMASDVDGNIYICVPHDHSQEYRDGNYPIFQWRERPDPEAFNPLIQAITSSLLASPSLRRFRFCISEHKRIYFAMAFLRSNIFTHLDTSMNKADLQWFNAPGHRKLYIRVFSRDWKVPRDLGLMWHKLLDGEYRFAHFVEVPREPRQTGPAVPEVCEYHISQRSDWSRRGFAKALLPLSKYPE